MVPMAPDADASRCPECGAELPSGAAECRSCGHTLDGPPELPGAPASLRRAKKVPPPQPSAPPDADTTPEQEPATADSSGPAVTARQRSRLALTLGAACLLGAAAVVMAVGWDRLAAGGRIALLLGMTAVAVAMSAWAGHRRLTAQLEAFGLVALGLWTLDLFGVASSGWAGHFEQSATLTAVGVILVVTGIVTSVVVRLSTRGPFRAGEAFAVVGAISYTTGLVTFEKLPLEQGLVVALIGTIVTAQAANTFRLAVGIAGGTAVSLSVWLALVWRGSVLALETPGWHKLWLQGHGWPLMVAALLPWLPAVAQTLPLRAREVLVGIGGLPLLLLIAVPALRSSPNRVLVIALAVLAASALVVRVAPAPIGSGWVIPTAVGVAGGAVLMVDYAGLGVERIAAAAAHAYGGEPDGSLATMLIPERVPDPAFNGLLSLVLFIAAWAVAARVWRAIPRDLPARSLTAFVAGMAWLGAITLDLPVWTWIASGLTVAAGFAADAARTRRLVPTWAAGSFLVAGVVVSVYSAPLNVAAAGVGVVLGGVVAMRDSRRLVRATFAAAGTILLADTIWATRWWVVGANDPRTALFAVCVLGALVVGLAGPAGHAATRAGWTAGWYGAVIGAVLSWPFLALAGTTGAAQDVRAQWLAAYVAAVAVSLVASGLLARGRRVLVTPGAARRWWRRG